MSNEITYLIEKQAARIAELEAERDWLHHKSECLNMERKSQDRELAALRRKIDELEAWRQLAFEAHPNLDLDIEHISKEDLQK